MIRILFLLMVLCTISACVSSPKKVTIYPVTMMADSPDFFEGVKSTPTN